MRVQCPNWFDVDRIQVLLNGLAAEELNFRRREHPAKFSQQSVRFDQKIPIQLDVDSHMIVVAVGEDSVLGSVMGPDHEQDRPIAVSNPIFIDVHGDGFKSNGDMLGLEVPYLREGERQQ